ncbi:MAG: VWA domain-containing protein [Treponema sp.]|nr:VWA domain-containing protein [Treponema sp.]
MKKSVFALIIIGVLFCLIPGNVYGQNTAPIDLILVLDSSVAMSSSYDNVMNYLTGQFLTEFLRLGDTFHLIAFSNTPRLDVARRITGIGDLETIIARMLLQYPIEIGSNVASALNFAESYIGGLPARAKQIVVITTASPETTNLITAARGRLAARNTTIHFVEVIPGQPLSGLPGSGRPPRTPPSAPPPPPPPPAPPVPPPPTIHPPMPPLDTVTERIDTPPADTWRPDTETVQGGAGIEDIPGFEVSEIDEYDYAEVIETGENEGEEITDAGEETEIEAEFVPIPVVPVTPPGVMPPDGTPPRRNAGEAFVSSLPFIIGIIILILLLLVLLFFLLSRKLRSSPNRVMAQASTFTPRQAENFRTESFKDHSKDLERFAATSAVRRTTPYDDRPVRADLGKSDFINPAGPLLLNLFVDEQNTAIGKRNIHSLKSGYNLSVGGGKKDDYFIFLVPVPGNIGTIRRDGSQLTFTPRKPKYFPELGSKELRDCINKTIRIVSDKNYEVRFRFENTKTRFSR